MEYGTDEPNSSLEQPKLMGNSKDPEKAPSEKRQRKKRKRKASANEESKAESYNKNPPAESIESLHDRITTFNDFENPTNIFLEDSNTVYTNVNLDVDKSVARLFDVNHKISKFFVVGKGVFLDMEPALISDDKYYEYSLYKVMKTEPAEMHDIGGELTDEDLTEDMFIRLEVAHKNQGVIINSNVYLTNEQWNTITLLDKDIYSCSVCQFQCDAASVAGHIGSITHGRKLNEHMPLKRFDLSITRKINENFHCAVCNVMFPIKNYRDHENSKSHEGNLLFAINKVSDLPCSSESKTTQVLIRNNIQVPNNAPRNISNTEFSRNTDSRKTESFTYSDATRNILQKSEDGYCFGGDSSSEDSFNFGKSTFEDIKIYEEDDMEEYTLPIEGVSYASMASRPRLDVPKFVKIDLGTKEVRVKFESWNMITQIDLNKLYCMVCTKSFLIRFKNQHCMDELHRRSLAKCAVVGAFEDYLIRDVSEKLYHCGHCNNLQYKNDMKVHIEINHPIKNSKTATDKNQSSSRISLTETYKITDGNALRNTVNNVPDSSISNKEFKSLINTNLDIFGNFKFCPFGTEIVVSNLGCHTLMLVNSKYHCALCNICVKGDLKDHVYEMEHMQFINMTPFIRPFQSNLTRAIRGSLHCAICNILIPVGSIYDHNVSPPHTSALARALGMVKSERPRNEVRYHFEGPVDIKTSLEKFLFTLPATFREALSELQITNHKGETIDLSDTASLRSCSTNGTQLISLNNSPLHIKKEDTKKKPVAMTDPSCYQKGATETDPVKRFFANFTSPINDASNVKGPLLKNENNSKSPPIFDANLKGPLINDASYFKGPLVNNASNPNGLSYKDTSNFKGPSLIEASNWPCLQLNNASNFKGPSLNSASNLKGPSLNSARKLKGPSLNNASNLKGPSLSNASNLKVPPLYYDAVMKGLTLETGQLVTLDTIASRVGSGAHVTPFRPVHPQITGPLDLTMESGSGRTPVTPIMRSENNGTGRGLLSPRNQKVEPKVETTTEVLPAMDSKTKSMGKVKGDEMPKETPPEMMNDSLALSDDEETLASFKLEESVLLKLKSTYFQITNTAYQSLVHLNDGTRYCFVCSNNLDYCLLRKHVDSRGHIDNMSKNKFLFNFCGQLFRQMYLMYHCAICNVTMSRKEVKMHLEWPAHTEKYDRACKNINKKALKVARKSGVKEYCVETQKEFLYVKIPEPTLNIMTYMQASTKDFEETFVEKKLDSESQIDKKFVRKNQMIILRGNMMKISFECWHGIVVGRSGAKCIICQLELTEDSLPDHFATKFHSVALGITFEKQYYPALIRKINANTVNCVICNLELPNDESLVFEHINGRKHDKNYRIIIEKTSHTDSYSDCYPCPITL